MSYYLKSFLLTLVLVQLGQSLSILLGVLLGNNDVHEVFNRIDLQFFIIANSIVYSLIFSAISNAYKTNFNKILYWNISLILIIFLYSYLFYSHKVDWLEINNNNKKLSLYESVLYSDFLIYAIYFSSLFLYWLNIKYRS